MPVTILAVLAISVGGAYIATWLKPRADPWRRRRR